MPSYRNKRSVSRCLAIAHTFVARPNFTCLKDSTYKCASLTADCSVPVCSMDIWANLCDCNCDYFYFWLRCIRKTLSMPAGIAISRKQNFCLSFFFFSPIVCVHSSHIKQIYIISKTLCCICINIKVNVINNAS